jgi:hypothetical protein
VNTNRHTTLTATLTIAEVIAALKAAYPDLTIQAMPDSGKGAAMSTLSGMHLKLQFEKET